MVRLILALFLIAVSPSAVAQTTLADFAGLWERSGPRLGPGGPEAPPPKGPRGAGRNDNADGSVTIGLGAPPPDARRDGPPISEADASLGLERGDIRVRSMMTPAGRARFAEFELSDHPMYSCISPGLPTVMLMPGRQDWDISGDTLTVRQETWPEPRSASLSTKAVTAATHTRQGQASADIKDGALVITTTKLTEAWGGLSRNAPGSAERTVVETYRMVDKDTISGVIEITDPLYLTQPLRLPVLLRRAPQHLEIEVFPCEDHTL